MEPNRPHGARDGRVADWRYRLRRFLRVPSVTLDGLRLLAYRSVPKGLATALARGDYEVPERTAVRAILRPDDRVLEIGGCVGVVAMTAARVLGPGRVASYEANPAAAEVARRNVAANRLAVTVIAAAVGARAGAVELAVGADNWLGSSARRRLDATLRVPVVAIADAVAEHRPSVLVLDAEGMEEEILPACPLADIRAVVVEFHPDVTGPAAVEGLRALLGAAGFARRDDLCAASTETWARP